MSDKLVRAISRNGQVRGFAAQTKVLVQELQRRQQTTPVASAALGRTATMAAIMGSMLKEPHHKVSIQVVGDGPIGKISVDANGKGEVRGTVDEPYVDLPLNSIGKLDVAGAVGQGQIYLIRDLGLKEPYKGTSPIVSGELAEDFTYYFAASEQIPSSVGLGVLVKRQEILAAGGYLIQIMPGATEDTISALEQKIAALTSVTDVLSAGTTPAQLLQMLMGEQIDILSEQPIQFTCRCSRAKVEKMLFSLGKQELQAILQDIGKAEVTCHYCNELYHFTDEDLKQLIEQHSQQSNIDPSI